MTIKSSSESSGMKRADKRSSITVLVLGDEGVGKSSLISTFVSRYFSDVVPGIMTRVRLPPDPETQCVTTIVDSQNGDAALIASAIQQQPGGAPASLASLVESSSAPQADSSSMEHVDSVVLVYDLDRVETFFRLENHWLPLIERCYNGKVPVIVAENKVDLYRPSSTAGMTDEQALARKRQQIVSLMQRFPFVRQCIKCSAKNLLRVDDVFVKAQQAVIYPFTPPLYELETGRLSVPCKRAFTRIFRIYDKDHDGLLSDSELDRFQRETYHVAVFDRDFAAWKKVVTRNNLSNEVVIQDGKFTIAGFLSIFDVFISQNRLDVVWQALRKFGYDDDLNLHVPDSVATPSEEASWKLTPSARKFLSALFYQFDSDHDGVLSAEDIVNIFSILPVALPPWHPIRRQELFEKCLSTPVDVRLSGAESLIGQSLLSLSQSGISILSAGDSLPSVDMGLDPVSRPLTFLEWIGLWHTVAAISPPVARSELFRLGHIEESGKKDSRRRRSTRWKKSVAPADGNPDANLRSKEIRILVLGSHGSGKTALVNVLRGGWDSPADTRSTQKPETSSTFVKLKKKRSSEDEEELVVHLIFTDVPETAAASQEEHYRQLTELFGSVASPKDRVCDLALLVFDCTKASSLLYAKELESKLLTKETPRAFVGTKIDLARGEGSSPSPVVETAREHCRESDLEEPLLMSAGDVSAGSVRREEALEHLARCALFESGIDRLRSRPHEEQKRREAARRRKMLWLGGIVGVGVVVAMGVGFFWGGNGSVKNEKKGTSTFGWLRLIWFGSKAPEEPPNSS